MMLSVRNFVFRTRPMLKSIAQYSKLSITIDDGIAVLKLNRPPSNALDLDMLKDLSSTLDDLARNRTKGLILSSALQSIFSSGLDVMEFYKLEPVRGREFWETLQNVWLKLFASDCVTVAAINGPALAAGCMLALSCEHRVITPQATMGLNEVAVGLIPPTWFMTTMSHVIPMRQTELALTTGRIFSADEAKDIGLVDYISEGNREAISKCKEIMKHYDDISLQNHSLTKTTIRSRIVKEFMENREKDTQFFLDFFSNPRVQKGVEKFIQSQAS